MPHAPVLRAIDCSVFADFCRNTHSVKVDAEQKRNRNIGVFCDHPDDTDSPPHLKQKRAGRNYECRATAVLSSRTRLADFFLATVALWVWRSWRLSSWETSKASI